MNLVEEKFYKLILGIKNEKLILVSNSKPPIFLRS